MSDNIRLVKADVVVEVINDPECEGCCGTATQRVMLDLRSAGEQVHVGCYCEDCVTGAIKRIQDGLPEDRLEDELQELRSERDRLQSELAKCREALAAIHGFPVHSEPHGAALTMQDIAKVALEGGK